MARFCTFVLVDPHRYPSIAAASNAATRMLAAHCTSEPWKLEDLSEYKCDGFEIGGEIFNGCLWDEEERAELPKSNRKDLFGFPIYLPENNIRKLGEVRRSAMPAVCITPDGEWHDFSWMMPGESREKWGKIYEKYSEYLVVVFECHR